MVYDALANKYFFTLAEILRVLCQIPISKMAYSLECYASRARLREESRLW